MEEGPMSCPYPVHPLTATSPTPPEPYPDPDPDPDRAPSPAPAPWHDPGPPVRRVDLPPNTPSPGIPVDNE